MNTTTKKLCATVFTALIAMTGFFASARVEYLVLNFKDGTSSSFHLADDPVMHVADKEFTIDASNATVTVMFEDLVNYTFSEESALMNVTEDNEVDIKGDVITLTGLTKNSIVTVFNINGQKVIAVNATSDGSASIDLSNQSPGVYVIYTASVSFKFLKK